MAKAQKGKIFCKRKGKGNYSPTFLAPTLPGGNLSANKTASLGRVWGILQNTKKPLLAEKTDNLVPQAPGGHPQAQASRRSSQSVGVRAPSSILGLRVYDSNIYYTLFLNEPNPPISISFTISAYNVVRNFQRVSGPSFVHLCLQPQSPWMPLCFSLHGKILADYKLKSIKRARSHASYRLQKKEAWPPRGACGPHTTRRWSREQRAPPTGPLPEPLFLCVISAGARIIARKAEGVPGIS